MSDPVSKTPEESKLPADDGHGVTTTAFSPEGMVVTAVTPTPEETPTLRCNRCNKPITPEEAVLTPTGYRCRDCVNSQLKVFDTTKGLVPGLRQFATESLRYHQRPRPAPGLFGCPDYFFGRLLGGGFSWIYHHFPGFRPGIADLQPGQQTAQAPP